MIINMIVESQDKPFQKNGFVQAAATIKDYCSMIGGKDVVVTVSELCEINFNESEVKK